MKNAKNNKLPLAAEAGEITPVPQTAPPPWVRPIVEEILREAGVRPPDKSAAPPGFMDFRGLVNAVPLGERTLRTLIKQKVIPHVRLKGGRRLLFHRESVDKALLRFQQGGIEA